MKRKIAEYNYEVDEEGNIYNATSGKMITQAVNRDGYKTVKLWKNNKSTTKAVHRFVAILFIPNPENKPCVNHIDGNKQNNHFSNLEWNTYSENAKHSFKMGLQKPKISQDVHNTLYEESLIHLICRLMQEGMRNVEIEKELNVPRYLLKNIRSKKCWKHISDLYKIPNRSRIVSEETILWIIGKLQEGLRICDIVKISTNPKVDKHLVKKIKNREIYTEFTNQYNF